MVEFWQSTQKMRTDPKTLDPELELYDPAFRCYALH